MGALAQLQLFRRSPIAIRYPVATDDLESIIRNDFDNACTRDRLPCRYVCALRRLVHARIRTWYEPKHFAYRRLSVDRRAALLGIWYRYILDRVSMREHFVYFLPLQLAAKI